jgi:hypothetical protein
VPGLILAGVSPDNTPSGYEWTYLFPMLLFIVIAAVLYTLFSRPHRRVPGRQISAAASGGVPSAEIAQAAAVAATDGSADDAAQAGQAAPERTEDSE